MTLWNAAGLALVIGYFVVLDRLLLYWKSTPAERRQTPSRPSGISVVIAVKNGAGDLERLIAALRRQQHCDNPVEYIFVDDYSDDASAQVFQAHALPGYFRWLPPDGRRGKKSAVTRGVEAARYPYVLTTDVDCVPVSSWVCTFARMVAATHPVFVAGPVCFHETHSRFEKVQALDFCGMMAVTGGGITSGHLYLANGANMCFERQAFWDVGGYEDNLHIASGDDMFLIEKLAQRHPPGAIRFLKSRRAVVYTRARAGVRAFFRQRLRWGGKNRMLRRPQIKALAALIWGLSWWILLSLGTPWGWAVWAVKALADYRLLRSATRFFDRTGLMKLFVPGAVFHILYIAIVGLFSLVTPVKSWKTD